MNSLDALLSTKVCSISVLALAIGFAGSVGAASPEPTSPFQVEDTSQLFVDRVLVDQAKNVAFSLHPARKHPTNPVVKADAPWEGWRLEIYGNVIYDAEEKIFKMWYLGEDRGRFPDHAAYYAVSDDGVRWKKPLVGTVSVPDLEKHNVLVEPIHLPSVIKDDSDPDPSRRYKMICWVEPPRGYHTMISPDGFNWTRLSRSVAVATSSPDTTTRGESCTSRSRRSDTMSVVTSDGCSG